ncbi:tryptophan synthase subunit alpha [Ileibacterium valens]|uniref:tryptophan synthase subunit alpha n=1 Tax=Ileibacterium valens TaxID=1862668 RepID=UPI00259BF2B5|nr:tryptophan synthase subunit alpha [Ileibacterium valens]
MSALSKAFASDKAFIPFLTLGFPDLETTKPNILAAQKAGANVIELGIPFSDPTAEGPIIQQASLISLNNGYTTKDFLNFVSSIKDEIHVPLVFMTYSNVVFSYGIEQFMKEASQSKISGIILADLSFEEREEFESVAKSYQIDLISMIAPTSQNRIAKIAKQASGFIYLVSSLGVTGMRSSLNQSLEGIIEQIRKVSDVPIAVGFGISNPEQASQMAQIADGVICGSAIIKNIFESQKDNLPVPDQVYSFVYDMKQAVSC